MSEWQTSAAIWLSASGPITRGCTPGNSTALFHKGGISNGTADHIDTQKIFQIKFEKETNAINEKSYHGFSDHKNKVKKPRIFASNRDGNLLR